MSENRSTTTVNQEARDILLSIRDLTVSFPIRDDEPEIRETILDHVSFDIPRGKVVGVVGESGSGKSMTSLAIMGLLRETARIETGSIDFDGIELVGLDEKTYRGLRGDELSMIFQEPMTSLNPVMKIGPQVEETLQLHTKLSDAEIHKRAREALESVGLEDVDEIINQYPHQLSGGQRQRVMIAQAMVNRPQLLIADEATTALDTIVQARILDLLREIHKKSGVSILFISHDLNVIRRIADEVVVMYHGQVVESGTTSEVLDHPKEAYTKTLVQHAPDVDTLASGHPILRMEHVNIFYDDGFSLFKKREKEQIVKDLTLTMYKGEILGVVGESGSGKSTIAKVLTGLNTCYDGLITFAEDRPQMVFQDPMGSLNPAHKIGWIMTESLRGQKLSRAEKKEKVIAMLHAVGLEESFYDRMPRQLSGGQRQRISIGLCLLTGCGFLIADEAVSALDVTVQSQILELLLDLHKKHGLSILFISHDLNLVRHFCHRVAVLKDGELVECASAEELYRDPKSEYTKALLAASVAKG